MTVTKDNIAYLAENFERQARTPMDEKEKAAALSGTIANIVLQVNTDRSTLNEYSLAVHVMTMFGRSVENQPKPVASAVRKAVFEGFRALDDVQQRLEA